MDDRTTTDFTRTKPVDTPVTTKAVAPKKRRRLGLLLILVAAAALGWWLYGRQSAPQATRQSQFANAMPVVVAPTVTGDIDITLNALGTVTSLATVTIKSQISG
jgi:membrane fusion protein, multidrug efflux system